MAEIWGAAFAAGGAILSGVAAEKKAKANRKAANEDRTEATKESTAYGALSSQFEAELADYYSQLNRQRKQRGLDQFRSFATIGQWAPEYSATSPRIQVGDKPTATDVAKQGIELEQTLNPQQASSGKKGSSGLEKVLAAGDPVLGKVLGIF